MRKHATSNSFSKLIFFTFLESSHAGLHGGIILKYDIPLLSFKLFCSQLCVKMNMNYCEIWFITTNKCSLLVPCFLICGHMTHNNYL